MKMRSRRVASIAFAGAVAATGTVMNTGAAHAASTRWTITPGGKFTATAGAVSLKDVTKDATLKCKSATAAGSISKKSFTQTTSASFKIGFISKGTFGTSASPCSGTLGLTFDATFSQANINVRSMAGDITHGTLTDIKATIHGVSISCTAPITGTELYSYNNTTGKATLLGTSTRDSLTAGTVNGCLGTIATGDKFFLNGIYTITPRQTVAAQLSAGTGGAARGVSRCRCRRSSRWCRPG